MYHDIMRDCPTREKRAKHAYKTYTLVVKMYEGTRLGRRRAVLGISRAPWLTPLLALCRYEHLKRAGFGQDDDFFVLGEYRGEEKARAHMHSSVPMVLDISQLAGLPHRRADAQ